MEGALTCGDCRREAAEVKPGIGVSAFGGNKSARRSMGVSDSSSYEEDSSDGFDSDDEDDQM